MQDDSTTVWLADAQAALDLVGEAGEAHRARLQTDLASEPVVVLIGAFSTGKSSLIKRMCADFGVGVPDELVIDAKPTTSTTYDVQIDGVRWRDTPGLDSRSVDHGRVADAAAAYADVIVITLTPELFSPDDELGRFAAALADNGPLPVESVHAVLTRADEQAGVRGGARFLQWANDKSAEARALLATVGLPDVPVHVVAADVRARNAHQDVTKSSYDIAREWDGVADMHRGVGMAARAMGTREVAVLRATRFALDRAIARTRADLSTLSASRGPDDTAAAGARGVLRALKDFERTERDALREAMRVAAVNGPGESVTARFHLAYETWSASAGDALEDLAEQGEVEADPWSWEPMIAAPDFDLSEASSQGVGQGAGAGVDDVLRKRAEKLAGDGSDAAKLQADLKAWEEAKRCNKVRDHYQGKDGFSSLREKREAELRMKEIRRKQQAFAIFDAALDVHRSEKAESHRRKAEAETRQAEREFAESQGVVLARKLFDGAGVTGWRQHIIDVRVQLEERIAQLESDDARSVYEHALDRLVAVRGRAWPSDRAQTHHLGVPAWRPISGRRGQER